MDPIFLTYLMNISSTRSLALSDTSRALLNDFPLNRDLFNNAYLPEV